MRFWSHLLPADHGCTGACKNGTACIAFLFGLLSCDAGALQVTASDFQDRLDALPPVSDGFEVTVFAKEPLVRQPSSIAFDARGRLFFGMGPQCRKPTPETPGDSVVILSDTAGDGRADTEKIFATGFKGVQELVWHGNDLWGQMLLN